MPAGNNISVWFAAWITALATGLGRIFALIPNIIGAIIILLIGWGIGKLIQALVTRGLNAVNFNHMTQRAGINDALQRAEIKRSPSEIFGIVAYWFVFLIAIQAAVNALGIVALSALMGTVILYLPRIFAALLIVVIGAWGASVLGRMTTASVNAAGVMYGDLLGGIVQGAVLFFAFAMALDFLGLSFPFLTTAFAILLGGATLAVALAFGLGGHEYAADILAGRELRTMYHTGDRMVTDQVDGVIEDIRPTFTLVRTNRGEVAVQNSELMRNRLTRPTSTGEGGGMSQAA